MNEYLGKDKTEKKKKLVIGAIRKHQSEEIGTPKGKNKILKEVER
ncbi:hypothetical protein [Pseudostreptobacillus sp.]